MKRVSPGVPRPLSPPATEKSPANGASFAFRGDGQRPATLGIRLERALKEIAQAQAVAMRDQR